MTVEADTAADDTSTDVSGDEATPDAIWDELKAADEGKPVTKTEPPPKEETEETPPADPDEGAEKTETASTAGDDTPEARIKALEEQNQRLEQALRSEKGRTKAKTREVETLKARINLNRDAVQRANQQASRDKAKQTKLDETAREYPEVAAPLVAELKELKADRARETAERQAQLRADEQALADHAAAEAEVFLDEHPDGTASIKENRDAFKAWIRDQPERVRNAYQQNAKIIVDGKAAAMLVSRWKLELAKASAPPPKTKEQEQLDAKRQKQLQGAQSTKSGAAPRVTTTPGENASPEDLWDYWKSKGL